MTETEHLARRLLTARETGVPVPRDGAGVPDATTGHAVQAAGRALHVAAGDRVAGRKIGLTTSAAQRRMGVTEPVSGYLLASTIAAADTGFALGGLLAPRVEVEVAFVLARPLEGAAVTPDAVLAATAHVAPALEIVDSRWAGGAPDANALIADDVSAAAAIIGAPAAGLPDLAGLEVTAQVGDQNLTGSGTDVLGGPARAVAWLCADLHRRSERLEAGEVVLSGAVCGPVPVHAGDVVRAAFGRWGRLEVTFTA